MEKENKPSVEGISPDIWLIEQSKDMPAGSRYTFAEVVGLIERYASLLVAQRDKEINRVHEECNKKHNEACQWKNHADNVTADRDHYKAALAELVRLKILKDELDEVEREKQDTEFLNQYANYRMDKIKAWNHAKTLLSLKTQTPDREQRIVEGF